MATFDSLKIDIHLDGTVVAAVDLGVDFGIGQALLQAVAHQEVVNTPACILLACLEAVAPPRIDIGHIGVEETPSVSET